MSVKMKNTQKPLLRLSCTATGGNRAVSNIFLAIKLLMCIHLLIIFGCIWGPVIPLVDYQVEIYP